MTDPIVHRPTGGPDVTRRNKRSIIYIGNLLDDDLPADDVTPGSVRLMTAEGDSAPHIELLSNDLIWNDTGLRVASSSLEVGRDMTISSAGSFLETFSVSAPLGHQRAFLPHNEFDESGTQGGHMPILSELQAVTLFDSPISEIISTLIGQVINLTEALLLDTGNLLSGSVAATQDVILSFYVGLDNNGPLFFRKTFPASNFPASSAIVLDFNDDFGLNNGVDYFMEFTSTANLSLQTDATGNIILSFFAHLMDEQDIITDNFILSNDLSLIFDNDLNLVVGTPF